MDDMKPIIEAIDARIADAKDALIEAMRSESAIPVLRAEVERLEAARKALTARQTPSGRKRIGEGVAKRAKVKAPSVPVGHGSASASASPLCAECKGMGTMGTATAPCTVDDCEAHVCTACVASHNARWHREVA